MRRLAFVSLLAAAGCAGASAGSGPASLSYFMTWAGYPTAFESVADDAPARCGDAFGTWFADWGVRGIACVAAHAAARADNAAPDPAVLLADAPMAPFQSGPHALGTAEGLALDAPRAFGRYDPAFVRWLADAAIPADDVTVALTATTYDRFFRRTARIYWLTYADLAAGGFPERTPGGPLADYAAFLDGGAVPDGAEGRGLDLEPNGGFSVFAFSDRSETLIPALGLPVGNDWTVKYEGNTAYGFWLRRRADGTLAEWRGALERLVRTYDAGWIAAR